MNLADRETNRSRSQIIDGTVIASAGVLIRVGSLLTQWFALLAGVGLLLLAVVDVRRRAVRSRASRSGNVVGALVAFAQQRVTSPNGIAGYVSRLNRDSADGTWMRNYPTTGRTSQDDLEWSDEAQGRTVDLGTHLGGA